MYTNNNNNNSDDVTQHIRQVDSLAILEQNRARNAMIIQRRVALKPVEIAKCVENTDLGCLPGT